MRYLYQYIKTLAIGTFTLFIAGCNKEFLEKDPQGLISESTLANKAGVQGLLIGAYSLLDGIGSKIPKVELAAISNFTWGAIAGGDAHTGSEYGDGASIELVENYTVDPTNIGLPMKWLAVYDGVQRSNDVIRVVKKVTDGSITEEEALQMTAEARFLRGVYHLEAAKLWRNVPYVDETITFGGGNYNVSNTPPVYPKIEEDFRFAAEHLKEVQAQVGRANSWAAKAFLAKVLMIEQRFDEALPLLTEIIQQGVNASGVKYDLNNKFHDNFNAATKNSAEAVFQVQMSVKDQASGHNGNGGEILNYPQGGPANCCGFFQPSFSLVNAFKTDPVTGLPLLDTWNDSDITHDQGLTGTDPFTPYTGTLDARLDWTVGRRGIPYHDWGVMPGMPWIRAQSMAGPYLPKKNVHWQHHKDTYADLWDNWAIANAINYNLIRFADVLLWAAEAEIEAGSLLKAEEYVNRVRQRAANPDGFLYTYTNDNDPMGGFSATPAANYKVGLYTGQFSTEGKDFARKAVRMERQLELAMEGHRFFDLQRWDQGTGYMADVLNAYIDHENSSFDYQILKGARFTKGKNELYPIPQSQIDISYENGQPTLIQNPNY